MILLAEMLFDLNQRFAAKGNVDERETNFREEYNCELINIASILEYCILLIVYV